MAILCTDICELEEVKRIVTENMVFEKNDWKDSHVKFIKSMDELYEFIEVSDPENGSASNCIADSPSKIEKPRRPNLYC